MTSSHSRRRLVALEAVVLVAWAGTALYQRVAWAGIQIELLQLVVLLSPLHLQRLAILAGCPGAWRRDALVCEALALPAALLAPPLSLLLALAGCLLSAWRPGDEREAPQPRALRGLVAAALVAATASVVSEWVRGWDWRVLRTPALALVLLEAFWPRRDRSLGAETRRLTLAICFVATTWFRLLDHLVVALLSGGLAVWAASASLIGLRLGHLPLGERRRALARLVFRLATPWVALTLLWGLGELAMRVVPNPYREMLPPPKTIPGWHEPHATSTYWGVPFHPRQPPDVAPNHVRWNSLGYHDTEHDFARTQGRPRVLVLGDSFVEGVQVKLDELYHRQLEALLAGPAAPNTEVMALGWSGWGQREELKALEELGLRFDPDLVILEFLPTNDVLNNSPTLQRAFQEQITRSSFARPLYADALRKGLLFTALVANKADQALRGFSSQPDYLSAQLYRRHPTHGVEAWDAAWAETERLIQSFRDTLAPRGIELLVVIFAGHREAEHYATPPRPEAEEDFRIPSQRFLAICERVGVACLDLGPAFAKLSPEARPTIQLGNGDGHWSRVGHRLGAEATAALLRSGGWLERVRRRAAKKGSSQAAEPPK